MIKNVRKKLPLFLSTYITTDKTDETRGSCEVESLHQCNAIHWFYHKPITDCLLDTRSKKKSKSLNTLAKPSIHSKRMLLRAFPPFFCLLPARIDWKVGSMFSQRNNYNTRMRKEEKSGSVTQHKMLATCFDGKDQHKESRLLIGESEHSAIFHHVDTKRASLRFAACEPVPACKLQFPEWNEIEFQFATKQIIKLKESRNILVHKLS